MPEPYYIGLDVHKKSISFCIKTGDGTIVQRVRSRPLAPP